MIDFGAFMMIIIAGRMSSAMVTYYYNYHNNPKQLKTYLSSTFSLTIYISILVAALFIFGGPYIFDLVYKSDKVTFFPFGILMLAYAALSEIVMIYLIYLKNKKNISKYIAMVLIQVISNISFQLIYIIGFGMGVEGALLGMVTGLSCAFVTILILEKGILTLSPDWSMIKTSLRFSIALIPYVVIYWCMNQGGRIFLERYSTLEIVGLFGALIVLSRLIILGIEAVINGIRPFLYEQFALAENSNKEQVSLLTKMIINIPLLMVPIVILVGTNFQLISDKLSYSQISHYICFATLVIFAFVYVKLFYQQLIFAKRSDLATGLSFIALIFLVSGFLYWIPKYEIWGVLYATLLGNLVLALMFFLAGQKVVQVSYNFTHIILIPIFTFAIVFIIEWWMISQGYSYSMFGIVQFIIVSLLILLLNRNSIRDYKFLFLNRNK